MGGELRSWVLRDDGLGLSRVDRSVASFLSLASDKEWRLRFGGTRLLWRASWPPSGLHSTLPRAAMRSWRRSGRAHSGCKSSKRWW